MILLLVWLTSAQVLAQDAVSTATLSNDLKRCEFIYFRDAENLLRTQLGFALLALEVEAKEPGTRTKRKKLDTARLEITAELQQAEQRIAEEESRLQDFETRLRHEQPSLKLPPLSSRFCLDVMVTTLRAMSAPPAS